MAEGKPRKVLVAKRYVVAAAPKSKVGRPSKYDPVRHPKLALAIALLGGTDEENADLLGIHKSNYYEWKNKHPEFRDAIESGKEQQDALVENALLKSARGFSIKEQKVVMVDGKPAIIEVDKEFAPNPVSASFWLRNRKGKYWKERHEVKHEGELVVLNFDKADEDL